MKILVDRSFDKDVSKIRSKKILLELKQIILLIERVQSIHEVPYSKKN